MRLIGQSSGVNLPRTDSQISHSEKRRIVIVGKCKGPNLVAMTISQSLDGLERRDMLVRKAFARPLAFHDNQFSSVERAGLWAMASQMLCGTLAARRVHAADT